MYKNDSDVEIMLRDIYHINVFDYHKNILAKYSYVPNDLSVIPGMLLLMIALMM